jgi:hypothetical protein
MCSLAANSDAVALRAFAQACCPRYLAQGLPDPGVRRLTAFDEGHHHSERVVSRDEVCCAVDGIDQPDDRVGTHGVEQGGIHRHSLFTYHDGVWPDTKQVNADQRLSLAVGAGNEVSRSFSSTSPSCSARNRGRIVTSAAHCITARTSSSIRDPFWAGVRLIMGQKRRCRGRKRSDPTCLGTSVGY